MILRLTLLFLLLRNFYPVTLKQPILHVTKTRTLFGVDPTQFLGGDRSKEYSETKLLG